MIGRTIAQYEILAELGRGGMGVVYKARDTRLGCLRALKFLPTTSPGDRHDQIRLVNEARSLAALEHPGICPVQEIGTFEGQTFIVMSYLAGQTLKERLRNGPLPPDQVLEIARQVGEGLAMAHARGIVHRDIKPENVMLVPPGEGASGNERAVVMDFGLAKAADTTQVTQPGTVLGTVAYMSPEQTRGDEVDQRTDLWSLGVVIHEMATGSLPFCAGNPAAMIHAIGHLEPEPLVVPGGETPPGLPEVVSKALVKDRERRYASAGELLADLDELRQGRTVPPSGRLRSRRHSRWLTMSFAAAGLLAAAYLGWRWQAGDAAAISALAILPLADRSEAADQAHFAEGVTDELAVSLSKIGALTVVSPRSAAKARDLYGSNREIAAHLHVDALMEGSVQRIGDRARVSVQLVAADDDRLIWSESYTRDIRDLLGLQSEIAGAVATALAAELTPQEAALLARERDVVPEAYEAYLLGHHHAARVTADELRTAITYYEQAIALDPEYAQAHVDLASALAVLRQMAALPPEETGLRAKAHLRRALEIDPTLADAYAKLGDNSWLFDLDLAAAGASYARARELDPGLRSEGHAQYLNAMGRHEDALREAQYVVRRDPLDSFSRVSLAERFHVAGQFDAARAELAKVRERDPENWIMFWLLGEWDLEAGDGQAAVAALELAVAHSDSALPAQPDLAYAYLLAGRGQEAGEILERLEARSAAGYVPPFYLAVLYAAFDRRDEAFAALDAAYAERDFYLTCIGYMYPALRKLRSDPRWDELVARIGLPSA